jgi:preprotein translocase subunit YajC
MTLNMKKIDQVNAKYLVLSLVAWVGSTTFALADGPAIPAGSSGGGTSAAQQPSGIMAIAPFLLMFAVLYFLIIRPQQKKMKEQQAMITALKHGDEIVTNSGILGKVTGITDKVVTVEVADNVKVKMLKSQVSQVVKGSIKELSS